MGIFLRILVPILLFPLLRWGVPRFLSWVGRRYDMKQAEKRSGGPVIEGQMARPTRDLRNVDFDQE
jgi:hypothetical protein